MDAGRGVSRGGDAGTVPDATAARVARVSEAHPGPACRPMVAVPVCAPWGHVLAGPCARVATDPCATPDAAFGLIRATWSRVAPVSRVARVSEAHPGPARRPIVAVRVRPLWPCSGGSLRPRRDGSACDPGCGLRPYPGYVGHSTTALPGEKGFAGLSCSDPRKSPHGP